MLRRRLPGECVYLLQGPRNLPAALEGVSRRPVGTEKNTAAKSKRNSGSEIIALRGWNPSSGYAAIRPWNDTDLKLLHCFERLLAD